LTGRGYLILSYVRLSTVVLASLVLLFSLVIIAGILLLPVELLAKLLSSLVVLLNC